MSRFSERLDRFEGRQAALADDMKNLLSKVDEIRDAVLYGRARADRAEAAERTPEQRALLMTPSKLKCTVLPDDCRRLMGPVDFFGDVSDERLVQVFGKSKSEGVFVATISLALFTKTELKNGTFSGEPGVKAKLDGEKLAKLKAAHKKMYPESSETALKTHLDQHCRNIVKSVKQCLRFKGKNKAGEVVCQPCNVFVPPPVPAPQ